jgi:ankyrin repeat protein
MDELFYACRTDPEEFKRLVNEGANVNLQNKYGCTPLHVACSRQPGLVEFLIERGANVNAQNNYGSTVLHYACEYQPSIVELLVKNGANVNIQNTFGYTPFYFACVHQPSVVRVIYDVYDGPFPSIDCLELRKVIALYSAMIWKRSKVGGLSSRIITSYFV